MEMKIEAVVKLLSRQQLLQSRLHCGLEVVPSKAPSPLPLPGGAAGTAERTTTTTTAARVSIDCDGTG